MMSRFHLSLTGMLLAALPCFLMAQKQPATPVPVSVMTYNIRMDTPKDGVNAWPNRKERVAALIREVKPAIFGLQEVLDNQFNDLRNALPYYASIGVGRDDGRSAGEAVPVFYLRSRFNYLRGDHFWLSETPGVPGKLGWDAACARMVTWVLLQDKTTGDTLAVFNTHFDHMGQTARIESARMLVRAADSLSGGAKVIITGDFNATTSDTPHQTITSGGYQDARAVCKTTPAGPEYTFTGFSTTGKPGNRIDFIYLKNTDPVSTYTVRTDNFQGNYLSDHLPVIITF